MPTSGYTAPQSAKIINFFNQSSGNLRNFLHATDGNRQKYDMIYSIEPISKLMMTEQSKV